MLIPLSNFTIKVLIPLSNFASKVLVPLSKIPRKRGSKKEHASVIGKHALSLSNKHKSVTS